MHNVILDTNIWLDWLLFNDPSVLALKEQQAQKKIQIIATIRMRDELELVLGRPQFGKHFANDLANNIAPDSPSIPTLLEQFDRLVHIVEPAPEQSELLRPNLLCKDKDDQIFIDLALFHSPCVLISKDKLVLAVAKRLKRAIAATSLVFAAQASVQGVEQAVNLIICRPNDFAKLTL